MTRLLITTFFILVILSACKNTGQQTNGTDLLPVAGEMEKLLMESMMPQWYPRTVDQEYGGFLSDFDYKWQILKIFHKSFPHQYPGGLPGGLLPGGVPLGNFPPGAICPGGVPLGGFIAGFLVSSFSPFIFIIPSNNLFTLL